MSDEPRRWYAVQYANGFNIQDGPSHFDKHVLDAHEYGQERAEEHAEFIIRACNSHDDLLAACEAALYALRPGAIGLETQLKAAIKKAKT